MTGTAFPTSVTITRFELGLNENKASTESIFTRFRQVTSLSGGTADRWEGLLETQPLDVAGARTMMAWLAAVGLYGTFNVADPMYAAAASGIGSALVQGAGQSGTSLIVDGVTPSATVLLAGEYFQVGDEYKIATADAVANGSGVVTLAFKPALRVSPADNAVVTFSAPKITATLTSMPPKAPDKDLLHTFTLSWSEYLP